MLCNDSGNTAQKNGDRGKRTDGPKKDMNAFRNFVDYFYHFECIPFIVLLVMWVRTFREDMLLLCVFFM